MISNAYSKLMCSSSPLDWLDAFVPIFDGQTHINDTLLYGIIGIAHRDDSTGFSNKKFIFRIMKSIQITSQKYNIYKLNRFFYSNSSPINKKKEKKWNIDINLKLHP